MNIINNRVNINVPEASVPNTLGHTEGGTVDSQTTVQTQTSASQLEAFLTEDRNVTHLSPNSTIISQALKAAGLPENPRNTAMVNVLLENNMSIGRDSLRSTLLLANSYPGTDINTLVLMTRASIPVNSESISTMSEFFNGSQIMTGEVNELLDMLEATLNNPATPAEVTLGLRQAIYDTLIQGNNITAFPNQAAATAAGNISAELQSASATTLAGLTAAAPEITAEQPPYNIVVESSRPTLPEEAATEEGGETLSNAGGSPTGGNNDPLLGAGSGTSAQALNNSELADSTVSLSGSEPPSNSGELFAEGSTIIPEEEGEIADNNNMAGRNDYSFRTFEELTLGNNASDTGAAKATSGGIESGAAPLQNASNSTGSPDTAGLEAGVSHPENGLTARDDSQVRIAGKALSELTPKELKELLKASLSLKPENLSRESIKALYERTNNFFSKVKQATEHISAGSALNSKASQALKDTALLNNLNRIYPHIELPLKLQNADAEGSLYVYTNRKRQGAADGHATALLHLNMPSLGLIDIHLDLADTHLGLNFYSDESSGNLLKGDISFLRKALEAKGYSLAAHFKKHDFSSASISEDMQETVSSGHEIPERLSFDIKA